jgi:ribosomal protein L20
MNEHDEQFEDFLREFTPAQPEALPAQPQAFPDRRSTPREIRRPELVWQRRLAAAAGIAIAIVGSAWFASHKPEPPQTKLAPPQSPEITNFASLMLTKLAVENPAQFEAVLAAASQINLPRFDAPRSSLRVLAKD